MKIANIVSHTNERVSDDFNVVKSLDATIQGLPTLIIGWEYIKENHPDFNILDRKLDDNTFWTFKRTENRDHYEDDILKFCKLAYDRLIKNIKYYFLDIVFLKKSAIKKLLILINGAKGVISSRTTDPKKHIDMVYMLVNDTIYGIDLNLVEYMGMNKERLVSKIHKKSDVFLDGNHIFIEYEKGLELLDYQVKYIPFLYTIKNG